MVQWLRLHALNTGGPGSIPGWGTRSHMPQLRVHMPQLNVLHAATKTQCSQINKLLYFKNYDSVQIVYNIPPFVWGKKGICVYACESIKYHWKNTSETDSSGNLWDSNLSSLGKAKWETFHHVSYCIFYLLKTKFLTMNFQNACYNLFTVIS